MYHYHHRIAEGFHDGSMMVRELVPSNGSVVGSVMVTGLVP